MSHSENPRKGKRIPAYVWGIIGVAITGICSVLAATVTPTIPIVATLLASHPNSTDTQTSTNTSISPYITSTASPIPTISVSNVIGYSVNHAPLTIYRVGTGSSIIVVMAELHGDEINTSHLVRSLMTDFQTAPSSVLNSFTIYFLPEANPDGLTTLSRYNADNVDLNRNWDTNDWIANPVEPGGEAKNGAGGAQAFSEPETVAISKWLLELRTLSSTRLIVISYHSATPPKGLVQPGYTLLGKVHQTDEDAARIAGTIAPQLGYPYSATWTSYEVNGEFIHWCADKSISCVDVELPSKDDLDSTEIHLHYQTFLSLLQNP